jgi:hypothetical protein
VPSCVHCICCFFTIRFLAKNTADAFIYLVAKKGWSPKYVLQQIKGFSDITDDYEVTSLNSAFLDLIYEGFFREQITLQLLKDQSISTLLKDKDRLEIFKEKLKAIEIIKDHRLFLLLRALDKFDRNHTFALKFLIKNESMAPDVAIQKIKDLTPIELKKIWSRKYRNDAKKQFEIPDPLLTDADYWFDSQEHVTALKKLLKNRIEQKITLIQLKKLSDTNYAIECFNKDATFEEAIKMTPEQRGYFHLLSSIGLTPSLALQIKSTDSPLPSINYKYSILQCFLLRSVNPEDSVKLHNLLDEECASKFLQSREQMDLLMDLFTPRYQNDIFYKKISKMKVVKQWAESTENLFHPGVILSALIPISGNCFGSSNIKRDFSNSSNPYAVVELAFYVMGYGREFFNTISDNQPILNEEFFSRLEKVRGELRYQFPEIAAYANKLKYADANTFKNWDDFTQSIEKRFGKNVEVQSIKEENQHIKRFQMN